jgi:transposase
MPESRERIDPVLGVDVARETVLLHDLLTGAAETIPNRYETLVERLEPYADRLLAVCEATGGYEDDLLRALCALGVPVHRADPSKVSHFARSLGRAKTDAIDARMLAIYGRDRFEALPRWTPAPHSRQALARLVARRSQLVRIRQGERTRSAGPRGPHGDDPVLAASFAGLACVLADQIAALDEAIRRLLRDCPALQARMRVLRSVPGVGEVTAAALLAAMPELGALPRRQAASLAGCAPHPRQSGRKDARRTTAGGRRQIKALVFVAAMSAARGDNRLAHVFKRLVENGKSKRCAYTAVARKIIVIANARLAELQNPNQQLT